jgi:hypothetical protein
MLAKLRSIEIQHREHTRYIKTTLSWNKQYAFSTIDLDVETWKKPCSKGKQMNCRGLFYIQVPKQQDL